MHVIEFGRRRKGKSTLALHIARTRKQKIVIFDPNAQFNNGVIINDTGHLRQLLSLDADEIPDVIIFRPVGDVSVAFDEFAEVMWTKGNYTLIVDESHNLQGPAPQQVNEWLDRFTRQAPTEQDAPHTVNIIQTMHRPQDANGIVLSQATHIIFFRFTKKNDIKVVERECGEDVAQAVQRLSGREFIVYYVDDERWELVNDESSWFEPIRAKTDVVKDDITECYHVTSYEDIVHGRKEKIQ